MSRKKIGIWRNSDSNKEANLLSQSKERVDQIEEVAESRMLTNAEISERKENKIRICELERFAKLDLQQSAKIRWLVDGDENSLFSRSCQK